MKLRNKIKIVSGALLTSLCCMTTSCNFLEIVPEEQAGLIDATQNYNSTLGFLYSCYAGIKNPISYIYPEASADEYAIPLEWDVNGYAALKFAHDLNTPNQYNDGRWDKFYRYIGQTLLFLQELDNAQEVPEKDKKQWRAEAHFLLAYYHFEILRFHGPCPITERIIPLGTPIEQFPGRMHYDYVTEWIVKTLDEKVLKDYSLKFELENHEIGRANYAIAMALKAKALFYAASPLWNGKFPYPNWKNEKDGKLIETPGYGTELVSKNYSRDKWVRAEVACIEALTAAQQAGHYLYGTRAGDDQLQKNENISTPFVPGVNGSTPAEKEFLNKVSTLRYMMVATGKEGNREVVWQLDSSDDEFVWCALPKRIIQQTNGNWISGYGGISPYLNTMERFYTASGTTLDIAAEKGAFAAKEDWLKRAEIDESREDIINLNVGREPRFYAWMGFDQGDYTSKLANGFPLRLEMKNGQKQGYNPALYNRDHCVTGFITQKFIRPDLNHNLLGGWNYKKFGIPLVRMAELYLNLAECQAMLSTDGKSDSYAVKALTNLNAVHQRAGLRALTTEDLNDMPLIEWIKQERFVELWGEGHRYFDIRRWVEGHKYLSAGKREGLNAETKVDPTFEEFNQRVQVAQPYSFSDRQYIAPVHYAEVNKNPQLVQAPNY